MFLINNDKCIWWYLYVFELYKWHINFAWCASYRNISCQKSETLKLARIIPGSLIPFHNRVATLRYVKEPMLSRYTRCAISSCSSNIFWPCVSYLVRARRCCAIDDCASRYALRSTCGANATRSARDSIAPSRFSPRLPPRTYNRTRPIPDRVRNIICTNCRAARSRTK